MINCRYIYIDFYVFELCVFHFSSQSLTIKVLKYIPPLYLQILFNVKKADKKPCSTSVRVKMKAAVQEVQYCKEMQFSQVVIQNNNKIDVWHPLFSQLWTAFYAVYLEAQKVADFASIHRSSVKIRQFIQKHSR